MKGFRQTKRKQFWVLVNFGCWKLILGAGQFERKWLFLVQMVNQLWLGGVFMIQPVADRICHFVTDGHAGHRAQGGRSKENGPKSSGFLSIPWTVIKHKLPTCWYLIWTFWGNWPTSSTGWIERGKRWRWRIWAERTRSWNAAPSVGHFVPSHPEMEFRIGFWNKCVICEFMGETWCVNLPLINPE